MRRIVKTTGGHDDQSFCCFTDRSVAAHFKRRVCPVHHGAGPVGEVVDGTVGAAVGLGLEIPNAVITGLPRDRSVVVREQVVVGEPLPDTVVLRPVPSHAEYNYAVVNERRVIVEPRTRRVVKIID